jgi:hypothetical protein
MQCRDDYAAPARRRHRAALRRRAVRRGGDAEVTQASELDSTASKSFISSVLSAEARWRQRPSREDAPVHAAGGPASSACRRAASACAPTGRSCCSNSAAASSSAPAARARCCRAAVLRQMQHSATQPSCCTYASSAYRRMMCTAIRTRSALKQLVHQRSQRSETARWHLPL